MRPTILIVEDDADISRLVQHHLEGADFAVRAFSSAQGVIPEATKHPPSLFLLDILLPGGNGLDLCRRIRETPGLNPIPVIFLTAKTSEFDRVTGLELGADDYISKPFSPKELVARVKAVLRRFERPIAPVVTEIGDVRVDSGSMIVTVSGKQVTTTATEFRLLDHLVRNVGRVFTRDQLLDAVWRETAFVTPRSVDVYVSKIREKIEKDPENPRYLKTVRGAGYRFEAPK
ncbi:MAG: response regulator transcription factor [Terriglobales bacterium]